MQAAVVAVASVVKMRAVLAAVAPEAAVLVADSAAWAAA
jgi:hypothetical protein